MLQRSARAIRLIEPCLPSPVKAPLAGSEWIYEIKHDGFRILARRDTAGVRAIDWTAMGYVVPLLDSFEAATDSKTARWPDCA